MGPDPGARHQHWSCLSHGPAAQGSTSVLLTHTDGSVGHCPGQGPEEELDLD